MIKRKISFWIQDTSPFPAWIDLDKAIEFKTDKPENSFDNAIKALRKEMRDTPFHVYYWHWLDI